MRSLKDKMIEAYDRHYTQKGLNFNVEPFGLMVDKSSNKICSCCPDEDFAEAVFRGIGIFKYDDSDGPFIKLCWDTISDDLAEFLISKALEYFKSAGSCNSEKARSSISSIVDKIGDMYFNNEISYCKDSNFWDFV